MKYGRNVSYASCLAAPAHTNAPHHVAVAEVCLVCVCLVLGLIFSASPKSTIHGPTAAWGLSF